VAPLVGLVCLDTLVDLSGSPTLEFVQPLPPWQHPVAVVFVISAPRRRAFDDMADNTASTVDSRRVAELVHESVGCEGTTYALRDP
jgi:hypothetical protein